MPLNKTRLETKDFIAYNLMNPSDEFPYKLRINIAAKDYTPENIEKIILLLDNLIEKHSSEREVILQQYKHCKIVTKKEIDLSDHKKSLDFWKNIKRKKKSKARSCAESMQNEEKRQRYLEEYINFTNAKKISESVNLYQKVINSRYRFIGQAQFTLYLPVIVFNESCKNLGWTYKSPLNYFTHLSHPTRCLMFIRDLELGLLKLGIAPGSIAETDSVITSFISLRQEKLSTDDEYVAACAEKKELKSLKRKQEDFVFYKFLKGNIKSHSRYEHLWKKKNDAKKNIIKILEDYTKGDGITAKLQLFFAGHWNRHYLKETRKIINEEKAKQCTEQEVIVKLWKVMGANPQINVAGSLMHRMTFIMEKCHVKEVNLNEENQEVAGRREQNVKFGF